MSKPKKVFVPTSIGLSILLGVLCYAFLFPFALLNPIANQWVVGNGDFHTHYLGWLAFLRAPLFQWPIFAAYAYGEGISTGIVYTDSIPIIAFISKILSRLLALPTFQYFGVFILSSFILQHYFCYLYLNRLTKRVLPSQIIAIFFVLFPPLLYRADGHTALTAQWIIVLCLLMFEYKTRIMPWILLSFFTLGVHFYLYAIVTFLFIAYVAERFKALLRNRQDASRLLILYVVLNLISLIFYGYIPFVPSDATFSGYGEFTFNLLSPISTSGGFSRLIPELPLRYGALEGISYPGLFFFGIILAFTLTSNAFRSLFKSFFLRHKTLLLFLLAAWLFSISPIVSIGLHSFNLGRLPWPLFIVGDIFRASGRFSLPIIYYILLNVSVVYIRMLSRFRLRSRMFTLLVGLPALSALIYLYDLSGFAHDFRSDLTRYTYSNPIIERAESLNALFRQIGYNTSDMNKMYRIRFYPVAEAPNDWDVFAQLASNNSWSTNGVYLARYNGMEMHRQNESLASELGKKQLKQDSIYVLAKSSENAKLFTLFYPSCLPQGKTQGKPAGHCHMNFESKFLLVPLPSEPVL